jgi:hypothetical protein
MFRTILLGGLVLVGGHACAWAADTDSKPGESKLETKVSAKGQKCCCRACTINFTKELGVPLEFLSGLGHRIHEARRAPDPVELAMAGKSLAIAEKVADKKASLTSDEVLKEAVALAAMRENATELAAIIEVVGDNATSTDLKKVLADAKRREAEEKERAASGATAKSLFGTLLVRNHTHECLRIFVDGYYVGTVHMGHEHGFYVNAHSHHNILQAICEEGGELVSEDCIHGHHHFYSWHIHD